MCHWVSALAVLTGNLTHWLFWLFLLLQNWSHQLSWFRISQLTPNHLFIAKIENLDPVPSKHWHKLTFFSHQLFLRNICQLWQNCRSLSPTKVVLILNICLHIKLLQTLGTRPGSKPHYIIVRKLTIFMMIFMIILNTIRVHFPSRCSFLATLLTLMDMVLEIIT